jgi:hypothetical protein
MTALGIEPATFWFEPQCLNQLRYGVPSGQKKVGTKYKTKIIDIKGDVNNNKVSTAVRDRLAVLPPSSGRDPVNVGR